MNQKAARKHIKNGKLERVAVGVVGELHLAEHGGAAADGEFVSCLSHCTVSVGSARAWDTIRMIE
jgi:hypothetical protein